VADLPAGELARRFVLLEFNRFLDYYKNAPDLNLHEAPPRRDAAPRGRHDRAERHERPADRPPRPRDHAGPAERPDRPPRAARTEAAHPVERPAPHAPRTPHAERIPRHAKAHVAINLGQDISLLPSDLIALVNRCTPNNRRVQLGHIEIGPDATRFEMPVEEVETLVPALNKARYHKRQVQVEVLATPPPAAPRERPAHGDARPLPYHLRKGRPFHRGRK